MTATTYPTTDTVQARIAALLDNLGADPEQIHNRLFAGGHQGVRLSTSACPVAHYLLTSDLNPSVVHVIGHEVGLLFGDVGEPVWVLIPGVLQDFIEAFDDAQYPLLIKAVG